MSRSLCIVVAIAILVVWVPHCDATGAVKALNAKGERPRRNPFTSLADEASTFTQLGMAEYVKLLDGAYEALEGDDPAALSAHRQYYRHLLRGNKVVKTVRNQQVGGVVDCVPFADQPSLWSASAEDVAVAKRQMEEAMSTPQRSVDRTCPSDTVGVARPVVAYRHGDRPRLVEPRRKVPPPSGRRAPLVAGYSYVDSPDQSVPNTTVSTYTVLGVGRGALTSLPETPIEDFNDHSINQGWWIDWNGIEGLISLEGGWIACAYFTYFPSLTLFAFSTPNGYSGNISGNNYNTQGGFIQYPGAPPLGNAMSEVLYEFEYRKLPAQAGFELRLRSFKLSENGIYFVFQGWTPLGFYMMSRYPNIPQPTTMQTGQEIYQDSDSLQLLAAGKIFGYGWDSNRFPILGNFSNFGVEISFRYGNFPIFKPGTNETGDNYVHFYGVPGTSITGSSSN